MGPGGIGIWVVIRTHLITYRETLGAIDSGQARASSRRFHNGEVDEKILLHHAMKNDKILRVYHYTMRLFWCGCIFHE
jgi:hypothetical protein